MAITIDYSTKIISVPQGDLTFISGTLYEMNVDTFRKALNDIADSEEGITEPTTHLHNTEFAVVGVTYARSVEIINGYSIQFTPDSQWTVRLAGANNNIFDVAGGILVQNQVQVIGNNSAGLVNAFADVLDEPVTTHTDVGSVGEALNLARDQSTIAAQNTQKP